MPCEVLGAGTTTVKQFLGQLYNVHDTPADWGLEEVKTPHFWICTILDAAESVVRPVVSAHSGDEEFFSWTGPQWLLEQDEVINANGKFYTWVQFQSFLVDQSGVIVPPG